MSDNPKYVLTDAEKEKLRAEAKTKVEKELRAQAMKEQLAAFEREERLAAGLEVAKAETPDYGPPACAEEDKIQVTISLPPFADSIVIDGKIMFEGHTYWVAPAVYASVIDQMQLSWEHQDRNQITSKNDRYRQRSRGRDAHLMMGAVNPKLNTAARFN